MTKIILLAVLMLATMTTAASAQQRTIYGRDGKVIGRVTTDKQGTTTIRDAAGRTVGTTTAPRR